MLKDQSAGGIAFRIDNDALYARYERLVRAMLKYPVSGWGTGGPPLFSHLDKYFETLLVPTPQRYPKPIPLSQDEYDEATWRRAVAGTVTMKAHHRWMRPERRTGPGSAARFHAVDTAVWDWALEVERAVNPICQTRESRRITVRRYLRDVLAFCDRWGLRARWAVAAVVDHHFVRASFGINGYLPLVSSSSWGDLGAALVVQVPGTHAATFEDERECFLRCEMFSRIDEGAPAPFTVTWTPDQAEQQRYEREQGASCVVVRWEPSFSTVSERTQILRYITDECEHRLGRALTKQERRELSRQVDPQVRAIRERFEANGWHVASDAPLTSQARWLARKLVSGCSWMALADDLARDDPSGSPLDESLVRRACRSFASHAQLTLPSRGRRAA
jgi:hypothetical protein